MGSPLYPSRRFTVSTQPDMITTPWESVSPEQKKEIHQILNEEQPNEQEFHDLFQDHLGRLNFDLEVKVNTKRWRHSWNRLHQIVEPSLMQLDQASQEARKIQGDAPHPGLNLSRLLDHYLIGDKQRELNWIRDAITWRLLQGEQMKALLRRRALERGRTQVDLDQEPEGQVIIMYLDIEPTSETYYDYSQKRPDGACLEFLQYQLPIARLVEKDKNLNAKGEYPASLLRAKIIESYIWARVFDWIKDREEVVYLNEKYPRLDGDETGKPAGPITIDLDGQDTIPKWGQVGRDDTWSDLMKYFERDANYQLHVYMNNPANRDSYSPFKFRLDSYGNYKYAHYVKGTLKVTRHERATGS